MKTRNQWIQLTRSAGKHVGTSHKWVLVLFLIGLLAFRYARERLQNLNRRKLVFSYGVDGKPAGVYLP